MCSAVKRKIIPFLKKNKRLGRHISKEDIQTANKYIKKDARYHCYYRNSKIYGILKNYYEIPLHTHQGGYNQKDRQVLTRMEKSESSYIVGILVGMEVQPLWKSVLQFLKMLNIEIPYNTATSLLDIYPKELKYIFTQKLIH